MKAYAYIFATLLLSPLWGCAIQYSAEPITARVVDAETKQPIEGVNIVAHWQLEGGLEGGNNVGQMMVMEAVTDANGKFSFPAWGPKEMPIGLPWYHANARLKNMDPEILLFKSGYESLRLLNSKPLDKIKDKTPFVRTSDWNGKMVEMKRFRGSLKEYAENLDRAGNGLMGSLYYATAFEYCADPLEGKGCTGRGICEWKNIPLMIVAIGKQTKMFETANIHRSTFYDRLRSSEKHMREKGCGSVNEFLREHEK